MVQQVLYYFLLKIQIYSLVKIRKALPYSLLMTLENSPVKILENSLVSFLVRIPENSLVSFLVKIQMILEELLY